MLFNLQYENIFNKASYLNLHKFPSVFHIFHSISNILQVYLAKISSVIARLHCKTNKKASTLHSKHSLEY
jgi:hypothetical protein